MSKHNYLYYILKLKFNSKGYSEIKKKNRIRFIIYNIFCSCFPEGSKVFLPPSFVPVQESGGELLRKIMNFPEKKCGRANRN